MIEIIMSQVARSSHPVPELVVEAWEELALIAREDNPGHPLLLRELKAYDSMDLTEGRRETGELREIEAVAIYGARRSVGPEAPEHGLRFQLPGKGSWELWFGQGESIAWLSEPLVFAAGDPALEMDVWMDDSTPPEEYLVIIGEVVELYYPPGQVP